MTTWDFKTDLKSCILYIYCITLVLHLYAFCTLLENGFSHEIIAHTLHTELNSEQLSDNFRSVAMCRHRAVVHE